VAAPTVDWQRLFSQFAGNQYASPQSVMPVSGAYDPSSLAAPMNFSPFDLSNTPTDQGYWQMPDYQNLWQGDPEWIRTQAQIEANEGTLGRQRADAVRQALIQFGAAPTGWSSGFGDVGEADIAAAQQNPFSTMKEISRARSMGSEDLRAALGARGILSSGAWTGGENMLQRQQELTSTQETNKLLSALKGYESSYGQGLNQYEAQRQAAMQNAFGRTLASYLPQWMDTTPVPGPSGPEPPAPPGPEPPGGPDPTNPDGRSSFAPPPWTSVAGAYGGAATELPGGIYTGHGGVIDPEDWATPGQHGPLPTTPATNPYLSAVSPYVPPKPRKVSSKVPSSIGAYIR